MGSFEKLVVATVFFLSAVVLAVTLSGDGGSPPAAPEGSGLASGVPAGSGPGGSVPAIGGSGERGAPERGRVGLLSAEVDGRPAAAPGPLPTPVASEATAEMSGRPSAGAQDGGEVGRGSVATGELRTREGLERSPLPDRLLYTWREGDTWTSLAQRYYGSGAFAEELRVGNDDARPAPSDRVLLPERIGASAQRDAADPRVARPAPRSAPSPSAPAGAQGGEVQRSEDGTFALHVVADGESLSSISERYYGTAARWRRIYDANRDTLPNPDRLKVGTKLRIP